VVATFIDKGQEHSSAQYSAITSEIIKKKRIFVLIDHLFLSIKELQRISLVSTVNDLRAGQSGFDSQQK